MQLSGSVDAAMEGEYHKLARVIIERLERERQSGSGGDEGHVRIFVGLCGPPGAGES